MPGKATIPAAAIELIIGIMPVFSAWRVTPESASKRVCPSAMRASMLVRSRRAETVSVSRPRLMPLSVVPRIMPRIGRTKRGVYQGSGPMMTPTPNRIASRLTNNSVVVPSP